MDPTLPDIKNFNKNSAVFYSRYPTYKRIMKKNKILLSHLVHSQIWLNLFVDNWQSGYIKNLRKKSPHSMSKIKFPKYSQRFFFSFTKFCSSKTINVQAAKVLCYCSYPIAVQRWNHKERKYFSFINVRLSWDV
jgi:hypothetical protein